MTYCWHKDFAHALNAKKFKEKNKNKWLLIRRIFKNLKFSQIDFACNMQISVHQKEL